MRALLILILLPVLFSCATFQGEKGKKAQVIPATQEMQKEFNAVERLYFAKKYDLARTGYQDYLKSHPENALTGKTYYRLGEIGLTQGNLDEAISFYRKAAERGGQSEWGMDAWYKQAVALHKAGKYDKIFKVLDHLSGEGASQALAVKAGSLRVSAAKKMTGQEVEEIKGYLEVLDAYQRFGAATTPMAELNWLVSSSQAESEIRDWIKVESKDGNQWASLAARFSGRPVGYFVFWKLGNTFNAQGDYKKAYLYLNKLTQEYPKCEFISGARDLRAELEKRGITVANDTTAEPAPSGDLFSVGVLLPLSGKYAVYGESVLHGIECAAGMFEPCHSDFKVNLVIRDTQGDPKMAARRLKELAENKSILGVIGPLPQVEVDDVVPVAEAQQIPIVALSQREDVARLGEMAFRNFLTVQDQVGTLVHYACKEKKWKKMGIFYPDNSAGEEFLKQFEQEVNSCGGKVVAKQSYHGPAENYVEGLKVLQAQGKFQALFIPDVYRRVLEIIPSLEFANMSDVVLLGGAGWDHRDLLGGGARLEGAVFVDGFFEGSGQYGTRDFSQMIQSSYGGAPTLLEAYAYDTMKLIGNMVSRHRIDSRSGLHDALLGLHDFPGVTGDISFDKDGDARRKLFLLTVSNGDIKEIQ